MGEETLLKGLRKKHKTVLVDLLCSAYQIMNLKQRHLVFGEIEKSSLPPSCVNGKKLFKQIEIFQKDSLDKRYYESFNVNSKNWIHVPEKTGGWFDRLSSFLEQSTRLSKQGEHAAAAECFQILYQLIDAIDDGDCEIVFADELGSWMIPGDERKFAEAYLLSLARTGSPEDFAKTAFSLICRENHPPFIERIYKAALRPANKGQRLSLESEIERQKMAPRTRHLLGILNKSKK